MDAIDRFLSKSANRDLVSRSIASREQHEVNLETVKNCTHKVVFERDSDEELYCFGCGIHLGSTRYDDE